MNRRSAILCPQCRKLVNADEEQCPYCGISRPGAGWRHMFGSLGGFNAETAYTYLLYLNVGMYVLSLLLSPTRIGMVPNPLTFLSPSGAGLELLGSTGWVPVVHGGRWWTLLTANYLHGGILHIFFNMAAMRQLLPLVTREFGLNRTVVIYTIGGVLGFVVSCLAHIPWTIGASAALCALIGALLYYGRNRGGTYGQAVFRTVWGWALSVMVFGFLIPGINNWAHGGGMAAGFLLAAGLGYREKVRETRLHRNLSTACVVATLAALGWGVLGAVAYRLLG
ncbi:MAG: rhomboid family intramembrane serine protease [Deferrisomatales bacterium]|nr:rhomboid family intramembrane serine protease [Deferrisomatales bacterium]